MLDLFIIGGLLMRRSRLVQIGCWCSAMLLLLSNHSIVGAQTKDPNQTAGTTVQRPAPTPSDQKAPQQDARAPAQTPSRTPMDNGIKVDPVKAAKTIIDIFGKKKPKAQPASTPQPEIPPPEPTVVAEPPAPIVTKPAPGTVLVPRAPSKTVSPTPAASSANAVVTQPARPPVGQTTVQQQTPTADVATSSSPAPVETPLATGEPSVDAINESGPAWSLLAALAALAVLIVAAIKWFLFPTARIDLEYETGESRLAKVASPFVCASEATFDLELEWGAPSAPKFTFSQAGGQS